MVDDGVECDQQSQLSDNDINNNMCKSEAHRGHH